MADAKTLPYVVFEDAEGNIISNDPLYLAKKRVFEAGQGVDPDEEIRAIQSGKKAKASKSDDESTPSDDDEAITDDESEDEAPRDYKDVSGKDLTDLAKERGIDLTENKTVGAVRAALVAQDEAAKASADTNQE